MTAARDEADKVASAANHILSKDHDATECSQDGTEQADGEQAPPSDEATTAGQAPDTAQNTKYTFFVGPGNNSELVRQTFERRPWWELGKEDDPELNLKWLQVRSRPVAGLCTCIHHARMCRFRSHVAHSESSFLLVLRPPFLPFPPVMHACRGSAEGRQQAVSQPPRRTPGRHVCTYVNCAVASAIDKT
jgi:hypothetical protein